VARTKLFRLRPSSIPSYVFTPSGVTWHLGPAIAAPPLMTFRWSSAYLSVSDVSTLFPEPNPCSRFLPFRTAPPERRCPMRADLPGGPLRPPNNQSCLQSSCQRQGYPQVIDF